MGDKLELPRQPEREATDAIRGFEYQRWASLELWLNLKDGEAIHVEWTEDVAVASRESGLAIQVKGTAAPVSLRQEKVRDLLEAAWARDRKIQTGLLTTSSIGNERHRGLLKGQAGIAYWQAVQAGTAPLEALKDFLLADEKLSVRTREAIRKSDAAAFEAFVRSVVWITDAPQLAGLQRRVLARLVEILADHPVPANAAKHVLPALLERITRASIDKDPQLRVLDRTERQLTVEEVLGRAELVGGLSVFRELGRSGEPDNFRIGQLESAVDRQVLERLEAAQDRRSLGQEEAALRDLQELRTDAVVWAASSAATKAAVLRLVARLYLDLGDPLAARDLASEANTLGAGEDRRLAANIASELEGIEAGLLLLPNPTTVAERVTKAALLMRAGDGAAAVAVLPPLSEINLPPNGWAIRIFAAAATSGLATAVDVAGAAEILHPHDRGILAASAFVRYASGHAKGVTLAASSWPEPVDDLLVSQSASAQEHFRQASELYRRCSYASDNASSRQNFLAWQMACVAALPDASTQLDDLIEQLAAAQPPHPAAFYWAMARGRKFDRPGFISRLEASLRAGLGDAEHVTALGIAKHSQDGPAAALVSIAQFQHLFTTDAARSGFESWTRRWREEVQGANGRPTASTPVPEAIRWATQSNDWSDLATLAHKPEADLALRVSLVEQLAQAHQWTEVHRARELLVEQVGTAGTLQLWGYAAANLSDWRGLLEALQDRRGNFVGGEFPIKLRRLYAEALSRTGAWPAAISEWASIVQQTGDLEDAVHHADNLAFVGQLKEAAAVLELRTDLDSLPTETLLVWSQRLIQAVPRTAEKLIEWVSKRDIDPKYVGTAFLTVLELATRDDLSETFGKLLANAAADPDRSGLRDASLDDIREMLIADRDRAAELQRVYENAEVPTHLLLKERLGMAFAPLLAPTGSVLVPDLFSRSGGRPSIEDIEQTTLALDVTGLVTAWGSGLYDAVLAGFTTVLVPPSIPISLQLMERAVRPRQPDRSAADEAAIRAVKAGEVLVGPAGTGDQPVRNVRWKRDEDWSPTCIIVHELVDWLQSAGRINADAANKARRKLGKRPPGKGELPLVAGDRLVLDIGLLSQAALAGILDVLLRDFPVSIDADEMRRLEADATENEVRIATADALAALRLRVADDLMSGALKTLPLQGATETLEVDDASESPTDQSLMSLPEILKGDYPSDSAVWIEDRRLSAFQSVNLAPIVGAPEIIARLSNSGHLREQEALNSIRRLRAGGFRFFPLSTSELEGTLAGASIQAGAIQETPGLATIRRSVNADFLLLPKLKVALPPRRDPSCESQKLMRSNTLALEQIIAIWQRKDLAAESKRAWARWVWKSFFLDRLDPPNGASVDPQALRGLAADRRGSVIAAVVLASPLDHQLDAAEWFWSEILWPLKIADPSFYSEVIEGVRKDLVRFATRIETGEEPDGREFMRLLVRRTLAVCPEGLQADLLNDSLRADLDLVRPGATLTIGDLRFEMAAVAIAAEELSDHQSAKLISEQGDELELSVEADFGLLSAANGRKTKFPRWLLDVASNDAQTVTEAIRTALSSSDASAQLVEETVAALGSERAETRIRAVHEAIERTVDGRLQDIESQVAVGGSYSPFDLAPVEPGEVLHWLRLQGSEGLVAGFLATSRELGPKEALSRYAPLALALGDAWNDVVHLLDPDDLVSTREMLSRSPIGVLAAASLVGARSADELEPAIRRCLLAWKETGPSYCSIVEWTYSRLRRSQDWLDQPDWLLSAVSWWWADSIVRSTVETSVDFEKFAEQLHGTRLELRDTRLRETTSTVVGHFTQVHLRILAWGIQRALSLSSREALSSEFVAELAEEFQASPGATVPDISLVHDLRRLTDPLSTGILDHPRQLLSIAFPDMPQEWLDTLEDSVASAVARLAADVEDEGAMAALLVAGRFSLSVEQSLELLVGIAGQLEGNTAEDRQKKALQVARLAVRNPAGAGEIWNRGETALVDIAKSALANPAKLDSDQVRAMDGVFDIGAGAISGLGDAERSYAWATWSARLSSMATPAMRYHLLKIMEVLFEDAPFEHRDPVWRALLKLRASA